MLLGSKTPVRHVRIEVEVLLDKKKGVIEQKKKDERATGLSGLGKDAFKKSCLHESAADKNQNQV